MRKRRESTSGSYFPSRRKCAGKYPSPNSRRGDLLTRCPHKSLESGHDRDHRGQIFHNLAHIVNDQTTSSFDFLRWFVETTRKHWKQRRQGERLHILHKNADSHFLHELVSFGYRLGSFRNEGEERFEISLPVPLQIPVVQLGHLLTFCFHQRLQLGDAWTNCCWIFHDHVHVGNDQTTSSFEFSTLSLGPRESKRERKDRDLCWLYIQLQVAVMPLVSAAVWAMTKGKKGSRSLLPVCDGGAFDGDTCFSIRCRWT